MTGWIIAAVVLVVIIGLLIFLYTKGNKMQKEQAEQKEKIAEQAQQVTMLVIDKKKIPLDEAGLPSIVVESAPKRSRHVKVPIVKAKVGPKVMNMVADDDIYDQIPVKAEIKAMVSGIYITSINNFRKAPVETKEKKSFLQKLRTKANQN